MAIVKPGASRATVAVLLSGGVDSSILLADLLRQGRRVQPIYVRCRLVWEKAELRAVGRLLKALMPRWPGLLPLVTLDLPVGDLYGDHWSLTGRDPPDAASPDDAVYLPGRNALLLVKAALWCQLHGIDELALGVLGTNPFADATPAFFDELQIALNRASGGRLRILRPYAGLDKRQVLQRGADLPLRLTFSCIAPVRGLPCGRCNKCAERQAAMEEPGMRDE